MRLCLEEGPGMKSEVTGNNEGCLVCLFLSQDWKVHSCGSCGEEQVTCVHRWLRVASHSKVIICYVQSFAVLKHFFCSWSCLMLPVSLEEEGERGGERGEGGRRWWWCGETNSCRVRGTCDELSTVCALPHFTDEQGPDHYLHCIAEETKAQEVSSWDRPRSKAQSSTLSTVTEFAQRTGRIRVLLVLWLQPPPRASLASLPPSLSPVVPSPPLQEHGHGWISVSSILAG